MSAVKCSKCGEELLGAVNRCWRCGQAFVAPTENGVVPPEGNQPIEVDVVGQSTSPVAVDFAAGQRPAPRLTTAELIDARRAGMMAMGGTVTSLVLGVFSAILALFWPPAALVAVLGLAMGLWGLSSPRRNLALVGMLLCCLAIGIGAYGFARSISIAMQRNRPVAFEDAPAADGN
jgi:hypothetical protein